MYTAGEPKLFSQTSMQELEGAKITAAETSLTIKQEETGTSQGNCTQLLRISFGPVFDVFGIVNKLIHCFLCTHIISLSGYIWSQVQKTHMRAHI